MKPDLWDQLTRVARQAPAEPNPEMPLGFDTRVLATMPQAVADEDSLDLLRLLRRALACAAVLMLISLTVRFAVGTPGPANELAYIEQAVQLAWTP